MTRFIAALMLLICTSTYAAGTITIVDPNQINGLKVNSDGSINANTSGSGGGSVTQGTIPWVITGNTAAGDSTTTNILQIQGAPGGTNVPVLVSGGFVEGLPLPVTPTDRGGTITTGGTAQNAVGANASRRGGWIQNSCAATEDLYVSSTTTATVGGAGNDADLPPCAIYSFNQNGLIVQTAISVIAATTAHRWLAKETQ